MTTTRYPVGAHGEGRFCWCGLTVYGLSLPRLYTAHDLHLATVRAMSRNNHPTRWENKP